MDTEKLSEKKVIPVGCDHDCGGRCVLKAHVHNGNIVAVETDDEEEPQLRACLRGRALRQMVHSPERLKFPLKRVGKRGEGKFEQISWDEALDTVAKEMKRIKENHGPKSILYLRFAGTQGVIQRNAILRLLNKFGGCTMRWGDTSCGAATVSDEITYGTLITGHTRDDLLNSRLLIMWGWNPANTIFVTNTPYYLARAKEAGVKMVCVDPRFTDTVATFADLWIPIKPSTDTAMLIAMAYVIIKYNLQDHSFLHKYTTGFEKFRNYVLGIEDGIPKSPAWAERLTDVPASVIENLAKEYATNKPAALIPGWAPGRTAYGEQFHRAASILATMTGNIGIPGGNPAGTGFSPVGGVMVGPTLPTGTNPAEEDNPFPSGFDTDLFNQVRVPAAKLFDAIIKGKKGGYPNDIKMIYSVCGNPLNQLMNTNKGVEAFRKVDFVVVHEHFMTPTAKFADILLPVITSVERNDLLRPWMSGPYYIYGNKAIDWQFEAKSDFQICMELASKLGISDYSEKTEDEWVDYIIEHAEDILDKSTSLDHYYRELAKYSRAISKDISDLNSFKEKGYYKIPLKEPAIAFREQIENPETNPFPTPSGKIEIFSQRWAEMNDPELPPIPKYIEPWEGPHDPLIKKYPLQLITSHHKARVHSSLYNIPWLREVDPQRMWINPIDAAARGITDGNEVRVFNERGECRIPVYVTERIMPGVVFLGEGAWFDPDDTGVDRGGCPNVLTRDEYSPAGAFCCNTCLVQVERVDIKKCN